MSEFDHTNYQLVIKGDNVDVNDPTKSRYILPFFGSKKLQDAKVAISNVSMFFSWFNITSALNNNTFQIIVPVGASTQTLNITIPDGYYDVSQINTYIQSQLIANNFYLINPSGNFVYYIELLANSTRYSVQLNTYPVPTVLPGTGWTNPGWTLPTVSTTPQLVVLPTNQFRTLIGYIPSTYPSPASGTTYSKLSDTTPKLNPVEQVVVRCNLVRNEIQNPNDIIYSFNAASAVSGFGSLINSQPYEYNYLDVNNGYYSQIEIQFCDQNYNQLVINDPSILVQLSFKEKKTGVM